MGGLSQKKIKPHSLPRERNHRHVRQTYDSDRAKRSYSGQQKLHSRQGQVAQSPMKGRRCIQYHLKPPKQNGLRQATRSTQYQESRPGRLMHMCRKDGPPQSRLNLAKMFCLSSQHLRPGMQACQRRLQQLTVWRIACAKHH